MQSFMVASGSSPMTWAVPLQPQTRGAQIFILLHTHLTSHQCRIGRNHRPYHLTHQRSKGINRQACHVYICIRCKKSRGRRCKTLGRVPSRWSPLPSKFQLGSSSHWSSHPQDALRGEFRSMQASHRACPTMSGGRLVPR